MTDQAVDVVVIGLGPGGEEVAGQLAQAGLSVVGIDSGLVGGECPYWGCIPSKMMIRAANLIVEARRVDGIAGSVQVTPDWGLVAARIREDATDNWNDDAAVKRFTDKGGRFVRGRGRMTSANTVVVGDQSFHASRAIVLATGSSPAEPPILGIKGTKYWTNHEAIEVETLPASLIVLGGGAIGVELAQVFARFGVNVTVVEAADRLLLLDEPEVGELLSKVFKMEGIEVITGMSANEIWHDGTDFHVTLADQRSLSAERLLVATGRKVDLADIGADVLEINVTAKSLPVDERLRVADGVWAVGDITGKGAFTHVAMYQAAVVVADILGNTHPNAGYNAVPHVTFTDPEVGAVGLSEAAAKAAGYDVQTSIAPVSSSARGWIHKAGNDGFIKLVVDRRRNVLLGATSMGPHGGEVLGMLTLAVHAQVPVEQLRTMIYAYPTFHRGVEDALRTLI
jgi:pyruvate/2-oxoglutarate dehydrogenase complex dihydrolipoamide dehydrogenase (E3) component